MTGKGTVTWHPQCCRYSPVHFCRETRTHQVIILAGFTITFTLTQSNTLWSFRCACRAVLLSGGGGMWPQLQSKEKEETWWSSCPTEKSHVIIKSTSDLPLKVEEKRNDGLSSTKETLAFWYLGTEWVKRLIHSCSGFSTWSTSWIWLL